MNTLPDRPCQKGGVLLVGINPAPVSVSKGHYYQGRLGQRLWGRLERIGLLDRQAGGWEDDAFVTAGHGLTDLVKRPTGSADEVAGDELRAGASALKQKIRAWQPALVLFAFRPPAVALGRRGVRPGLGPIFAGTATFLLEAPYASRSRVDGNLEELRDYLDGLSFGETL